MVVVGAGPAGAALAWVLASRGLAVTLIERQRDFEREFRGEGLMPGGIDALAQMRLVDLLGSVPHAEPDALELYRGGRLALRLRIADVLPPGVRGLTVSQPHLLEAIVARGERAGLHAAARRERARPAPRRGGPRLRRARRRRVRRA